MKVLYGNEITYDFVRDIYKLLVHCYIDALHDYSKSIFVPPEKVERQDENHFLEDRCFELPLN